MVNLDFYCAETQDNTMGWERSSDLVENLS